MTDASATDFRQRGGWFLGQDDLEALIEGRRDRLPDNENELLRPAVQALRDLIGEDPILRRLSTRMIGEVPVAKPYRKQHIRDHKSHCDQGVHVRHRGRD